jgi:hypothetical protein
MGHFHLDKRYLQKVCSFKKFKINKMNESFTGKHKLNNNTNIFNNSYYFIEEYIQKH